MARRLLVLGGMAYLLAGAGGCVLPPPLEIEGQDAGINSPPVVLEASPGDFAFPGPIVIDNPADGRNVRLKISDNDVDDTLFVRFFRDWDDLDPSLPVGNASVPASGAVDRIADIQIGGWCNGVDLSDTSAHVLEVMVADGPINDFPDPRTVQTGTLKSFRAWLMTCVPGAAESP